MKIEFYKYQGAGNDFIILDNRDEIYSNITNTQINRLCDRRFGIGADGFMLLQKHQDFDFEMLYFNADGNLGSMCGNGGRCIVAFAKHLKIIRHETNFLAVDGPHYANFSASTGLVDLKMIDVSSYSNTEAITLNTGSPHYVEHVENLAEKDVYKDGSAIRYNDTFKSEGINVNFVEWKEDVLHVRTYERGVENETLACGTGVTAAAMAHSILENQFGAITTPIKTLGGSLQVRFNREGQNFTDVFLTGPATLVFKGEIVV